jgi:cytochrome d ubiquinol oxidase subunit I
VLFVVVYTVVFSMGVYYINRLIETGPKPAVVKGDEREEGVAVAARPMSGATGAARAATEGA